MIVWSSGSFGPRVVWTKQKSLVGVAYSGSERQVQTPFSGLDQMIRDNLKKPCQIAIINGPQGRLIAQNSQTKMRHGLIRHRNFTSIRFEHAQNRKTLHRDGHETLCGSLASQRKATADRIVDILLIVRGIGKVVGRIAADDATLFFMCHPYAAAIPLSRFPAENSNWGWTII